MIGIGTNDYDYSKFEPISRPPIYCPNARNGHVLDGSLVVYREHYEGGCTGTRMGRVLGRVTRYPDGTTPTEDALAVLALSDDMSYAYMRYVSAVDVAEVRSQEGFGATLLFVLFGVAPSPEEALRACNYGAMGDGHLTKYLRGDTLAFAVVRERESAALRELDNRVAAQGNEGT